MADTVLYEVSDGLATITLNRPEAMNAMNIATKVALRDAAREAADDEAVRAILLTAAGRPGVLRRAGPQGAHRAAGRGHSGPGTGRTMSTVREHYNPIVRALTEMPRSPWSRG